MPKLSKSQPSKTKHSKRYSSKKYNDDFHHSLESEKSTDSKKSDFDYHKTISSLSKLMDENDLVEVYIANSDSEIHLRKKSSEQAFTHTSQPTSVSPTALSNVENASAPIVNKRDENIKSVNSPMVGTVYLSPQPGAEPFVKEGDKIKKGQTILIIEAMKVMNPITSNYDGIVTRILIKDKDPAEFDQELIEIKLS